MCNGGILRKRKEEEKGTYIFKLFDVVVGEDVGFLQIHVGIQGLSHQGLPEGGQQIQGQRDISSDGDAQELPKEVEELLLSVGDGAGGQDVLPLWKKGTQGRIEQLPTARGAGC